MAHQLQRVAACFVLPAALAALTAAPRRPFSHKYHLTQVAACENCHSTAAESTRAQDNLLPDKSACVTCHDEVEISEPNRIGAQKFNHALHVKMGNAAPAIAASVADGKYLGARPPDAALLSLARDACTGCHRGIAQSENVPHDRVAKAHFPQMADCLVCHNKINPPDSCAKCHAETSAGFRPASHTAEFGDKHSGKEMDKSGCATCHGRKFTCKGCH